MCKIPSSKAIWNEFCTETVKVLNSYVYYKLRGLMSMTCVEKLVKTGRLLTGII